MAKKVKKEKYPELVYIQKDFDGEEEWFLAVVAKDLDTIEDGEIAIYKLVEIKTKKTTVILE